MSRKPPDSSNRASFAWMRLQLIWKTMISTTMMKMMMIKIMMMREATRQMPWRKTRIMRMRHRRSRSLPRKAAKRRNKSQRMKTKHRRGPLAGRLVCRSRRPRKWRLRPPHKSRLRRKRRRLLLRPPRRRREKRTRRTKRKTKTSCISVMKNMCRPRLLLLSTSGEKNSREPMERRKLTSESGVFRPLKRRKKQRTRRNWPQ
mmetsp:Transcript_4041/g.7420  ORF Transcript_4041/g.7420 Transcript_4041/m.7420 type:complete len:202 (-) Transcript_4041:478-1083(-)